MSTRRPPLPTFIIIGAQKSATRWLRQNLGCHPDIFTAPREVKYFNHPERVAALGTDWYRAQFEGWAGEPVSGEATPGYLMLGHHPHEVATRIKAAVPDVRLIALLRNPMDRAYSAFVHHKRAERIRPGARLLDTVRSCAPEDDWMGIVTGGWYAASLGPFLGTCLATSCSSSCTRSSDQIQGRCSSAPSDTSALRPGLCRPRSTRSSSATRSGLGLRPACQMPSGPSSSSTSATTWIGWNRCWGAISRCGGRPTPDVEGPSATSPGVFRAGARGRSSNPGRCRGRSWPRLAGATSRCASTPV